MADSFQLYIDGEFCAAEGGATFDSIDPSSGLVWAAMPKASAADTDKAVESAHAAFIGGDWQALLPRHVANCFTSWRNL